jgi:hypothetical protein
LFYATDAKHRDGAIAQSEPARHLTFAKASVREPADMSTTLIWNAVLVAGTGPGE